MAYIWHDAVHNDGRHGTNVCTNTLRMYILFRYTKETIYLKSLRFYEIYQDFLEILKNF